MYGGTCGLNQHLFKVTSDKYPKWFYYAWTAHHLARFVAIAADKATTMGHIKREDLAKAEVIIPDTTSMERIGGVIEPIYDLIINQRVENRRLSMLRDSHFAQTDVRRTGCILRRTLKPLNYHLPTYQ